MVTEGKKSFFPCIYRPWWRIALQHPCSVIHYGRTTQLAIVASTSMLPTQDQRPLIHSNADPKKAWRLC